MKLGEARRFRCVVGSVVARGLVLLYDTLPAVRTRLSAHVMWWNCESVCFFRNATCREALTFSKRKCRRFIGCLIGI